MELLRFVYLTSRLEFLQAEGEWKYKCSLTLFHSHSRYTRHFLAVSCIFIALVKCYLFVVSILDKVHWSWGCRGTLSAIGRTLRPVLVPVWLWTWDHLDPAVSPFGLRIGHEFRSWCTHTFTVCTCREYMDIGQVWMQILALPLKFTK